MASYKSGVSLDACVFKNDTSSIKKEEFLTLLSKHNLKLGGNISEVTTNADGESDVSGDSTADTSSDNNDNDLQDIIYQLQIEINYVEYEKEELEKKVKHLEDRVVQKIKLINKLTNEEDL